MDPQQQFCLKWNSFGNNLVATFENLFKSSSLTDVTLFCEGVTFQAHRLILAACSKHFQDLFESAPISPSILVILDGTSSSNMSSLLEFMYKGEVHVAQESLPSFLKAAEYLQVKGLSKDTEKLITQSTSHSSSSLESKIDSPNSRPCSKSTNKLSSQPNVINKAWEDGIGGGSVGKRSPVIAEPEHSLASSTSLPYPSSSFHVQPHFKSYDHRVPPSAPPTPAYDMIPRKRPHKSPSDTIKDNSQRASVLRDGSKPERDSPVSSVYAAMPSSLPPPSQPSSGSHHFEPHTLNLQSSMLSSDGGGTPGSLNQTAAVEDSPSPQAWGAPNCAEDLRVKCEPPESGGSSTVDENSAERKFYSSGGGGGRGNLDCGQRDRELNDRVPPLVSSPSGSGKKLPCPYCERLYGYETNLRAHIRQRHHGIRVPCPYCSRTFTRNNTVRRHIAREHTNETDLKPTTAGQTQLQSAHNNQQQ